MKVKKPIPKTKEFDSTMHLINEGFNFLPSRRKELESDIFEARLLGKKSLCIAGEEAAVVKLLCGVSGGAERPQANQIGRRSEDPVARNGKTDLHEPVRAQFRMKFGMDRLKR